MTVWAINDLSSTTRPAADNVYRKAHYPAYDISGNRFMAGVYGLSGMKVIASDDALNDWEYPDSFTFSASSYPIASPTLTLVGIPNYVLRYAEGVFQGGVFNATTVLPFAYQSGAFYGLQGSTPKYSTDGITWEDDHPYYPFSGIVRTVTDLSGNLFAVANSVLARRNVMGIWQTIATPALPTGQVWSTVAWFKGRLVLGASTSNTNSEETIPFAVSNPGFGSWTVTNVPDGGASYPALSVAASDEVVGIHMKTDTTNSLMFSTDAFNWTDYTISSYTPLSVDSQDALHYVHDRFLMPASGSYKMISIWPSPSADPIFWENLDGTEERS